MKKIARTPSIPEASMKAEPAKQKAETPPKESAKPKVKAPPKEIAKPKEDVPKPKENSKKKEAAKEEIEDKPPADHTAVAIKQKEVKNLTKFTDTMVNEQLSITTSLDEQIKQLMKPKKIEANIQIKNDTNNTKVVNTTIVQKAVKDKNVSVVQKNATNTTAHLSAAKVAVSTSQKNASKNLSVASVNKNVSSIATA